MDILQIIFEKLECFISKIDSDHHLDFKENIDPNMQSSPVNFDLQLSEQVTKAGIYEKLDDLENISNIQIQQSINNLRELLHKPEPEFIDAPPEDHGYDPHELMF